MKEVTTRTCVTCGRVFVPIRDNQTHCNTEGCPSYRISANNRRSYYKQKGSLTLNDKVVQTCKMCGKQFLADTLRNKYCSDSCKRYRARYNAARTWAKNNGRPEPSILAYKEEAKLAMRKTNHSTNFERKKPMYNNNINTSYNKENGGSYVNKRRYTPEEFDEKLTAKTKRIIETVDTLTKANIDEKIIFDAVKNITRMPLSNF